MKPTIRKLSTVSAAERGEIVQAAISRRESQIAIAQRHRVTRSTVAQLVFQHRQNVKAGYASATAADMRRFPEPTIRRFSWEGAEA